MKVLVHERDNVGKVIPNKFTTVVGICTFIGINEHLGWLQVTVDRYPIQIRSLDDVKELKDGDKSI